MLHVKLLNILKMIQKKIACFYVEKEKKTFTNLQRIAQKDFWKICSIFMEIKRNNLANILCVKKSFVQFMKTKP